MDEPPVLRSGVDLTRVGLSFEEGSIAAHIDGRASVDEIATRVSKTSDEVRTVIDQLKRKRVVKGGDERTDPYGGFMFPVPLMQAEADVDEEERKRIIFTYDQLSRLNHYELMKVRRRDDAKAVKAAYQQRVLEWHPDRWRRPELGPFGRMITAIFERLKEANKVLGNEKLREAYDVEHAGFFVDDDDVKEMLAQQRRRERDELREREKIARRKRRNPQRARLNTAREQYRRALAHEEKEELVEALRAAQTALTFEPKNEDFKKLVERLREATQDHRIAPLMKAGRRAESLTRWDDAIELFEQVVQYAPENGPALVRLAYNQLQSGQDPQKALRHVQKAVSLLPDEAEAHYVQALCYVALESNKAAIRALERSLETRPSYAEAKKLLKRLRWGF